MKELVSMQVGGDGGKVGLAVDQGLLEIKAAYPVAKILEPLKSKIVDKLKEMIPGSWDDALIDKAWAELIKDLSE